MAYLFISHDLSVVAAACDRIAILHDGEIVEFGGGTVTLDVRCSKGTYIRSIARDFGDALGVGAYLTDLCRTRIGTFRLEDALNIDEVTPETVL